MQHLDKRVNIKRPAKPKTITGGKKGGGGKRGGGGINKVLSFRTCSQGTIRKKGGSFGSCPAISCGTCRWTGKRCVKGAGWSRTMDCQTICGCFVDR